MNQMAISAGAPLHGATPKIKSQGTNTETSSSPFAQLLSEVQAVEVEVPVVEESLTETDLLAELKALLASLGLEEELFDENEIEEQLAILMELLTQFQASGAKELDQTFFGKDLEKWNSLLASTQKELLLIVASRVQTGEVQLSKEELTNLISLLKRFNAEVGTSSANNNPFKQQLNELELKVTTVSSQTNGQTGINLTTEEEKGQTLFENVKIGLHQLQGHRPLTTVSNQNVSLSQTYSVHGDSFENDMNELLVRQLQITRFPNGVSEAKIKLFPENLGMIDVKLSVDKGVVTALFSATTSVGKEMLEQHLLGLRSHLIQQGLQVDKLEVVQPNQQNQSANQDGLNRQGSQQGEEQANFSQEQQTDGDEGQLDFEEIFSSFNQVI